MLKLGKIKGFTLAEALMALVIIAIISALCIPVLRRDNFRVQIETGAKKGYQTLESSLDKAIAFNMGKMPNDVLPAMLGQMSLLRTCSIDAPDDSDEGSGDSAEDSGAQAEATIDPISKCFAATDISGLTSAFATADGITFGVKTGATNEFYVDANGLEDPNVLGIDVFRFDLKQVTEDGDTYYKFFPDSSSLGDKRENAENLVKNGWKITAW